MVSLLPLAGTLVLVGVLAGGFLLRPPEWASELPWSWDRVTGASLGGSFLSTLLAFLSQDGKGEAFTWGVTCAAGLLGYLLAQSLITDCCLRLVDRRLQWAILILATLASLPWLMSSQLGDVLLVTTALFILMPLVALFLVPQHAMGPADWRTFAIMGATLAPYAPPPGLILVTLWGFLILSLTTALGLTLRARRRGDTSLSFLKHILRGAMLPAVPLLVAPALGSLLTYLFLHS